jgi:hypothetical protein
MTTTHYHDAYGVPWWIPGTVVGAILAAAALAIYLYWRDNWRKGPPDPAPTARQRIMMRLAGIFTACLSVALCVWAVFGLYAKYPAWQKPVGYGIVVWMFFFAYLSIRFWRQPAAPPRP